MDRSNEAIPHVPEADTFDFRASWESVRQACLGHPWLIGGTCLLTVLVVVLYMAIWPPVYHADVVLVADSQEDTQRDNFYQYWNVFRKDHLPDEVQLMTAGPVLERVVDELGLTYDEVYHPFLSYAAHLWIESWVGRNYRRVKEWFFPRPQGPYVPTPEQIERARTLNDFKKGVSLDAVAETNVGVLVVRGSTPRVAEIADTLVKVYLDERKQRHVAEADRAYQSLAVEAAKVREELAVLETKMEKYYAENGLLLMFEKDKVEISEWLKLKAMLVESESGIAALEKSLAEVDRQLALEDREITSARVLQKNEVKDELLRLELEHQLALQKFQPDSPDVREIESRIASVKSLMEKVGDVVESQKTQVVNETYLSLKLRRSELLSQLEGARAALEIRSAAAAGLEKHVSNIPSKMKDTHEMGREHDLLEKKYAILQEKLAVAAVSRAAAESAPPSMRVVEYAALPEKPSWPKTKLLLILAVMLGLCGGVTLALLMDLIYARVNRYRLLRAKDEFAVYAILEQDRDYVTQLFSLPKAANER